MAFHFGFRRRNFLRQLLLLAGGGGAHASASTPPASAAPRPGRLGGYIRAEASNVIHREFDVVVVGGGIAGTCAAIAAARHGARVALVHERAMLGGNSSSEVRLYPEVSTNHNIWCKETGILEEIHTEERVRNPEPYQEGLLNAQWDLVLYEWAVREPNLTLFLNTTMRDVEMRDPAHILAVHCVQMGTEKEFVFSAPLFVDSTGDGVLGYRAGAEYRWGMEARSEFGESIAPEQASDQPQMGSSLFFRARDAGVPVPYKRPEWVPEFATEEDLTGRNHSRFETGYWWLEVGLPHHQIKDNEEIKHEALRQLLGVWDHIKNHCKGKEKARNYGLDFVSFWPYKREARRLVGDYILRQQDTQDPCVHADAIAFGCWFVDIHKAGGILARSRPNTNPGWEHGGVIPYGIPLRSCYSRNVSNLLMAGRPISTSYVAFSSTRVLRTGAIVGHGVGVAAALCHKHQCTPCELSRTHAEALQQALLRDDCFLPGARNTDPNDLARDARVTASSEAPLVFPEGHEFLPLTKPMAQLFPVSTNHLDTVELVLRSEADHPVPLTLGLRRAEFVYDLRGTHDVARANAVVPACSTGWVRFRFDQRVDPGSLYWIHLPVAEGISWALYRDQTDAPAVSPVGTTAAELPGPTRWHPLTKGCNFSLRLTPEQQPYGAKNVVEGTNRPDRWPNIFISRELPAWIELTLPRRTRFNTVQLTFDTDMNRHTRKALFRYPDCVKAYDIEVVGRRVAGDEDNYLRRRVHRFERVEADRLRIRVRETNGAPAARIYEVRLYDET